MLDEFKKFAMRGNVVDMAVGIVIGAAFGKIVSSFVSDVLMPPIGLAMGGVDFSGLFVSLGSGSFPTLAAAKAAGAPTINYGLFINTLIDFIIIAFALFMVINAMSKMKKPEEAKAPSTKSCPECLSNIPVAAKRCMYCTTSMK
ncbi:MAG: large-conductance mechanosensitive channel protein MscL [Gammaproteobacteria bacterium]|nr:large-conductance mechanosensitive channel protein MscL [Gammaproteobacteria bacterium]MDH3405707.1 large-conductance mechanosensitive channel protein MscL [Gammaproteobacteria bacterium]MDH3563829.1 large-conductance mechanosensitive channel protein MscL [Gammaproteobacteria bacterium]MDH5486959.1 large-conductance mechanosensitive channel protein MscL [Gammaproteobacteria bacterium]